MLLSDAGCFPLLNLASELIVLVSAHAGDSNSADAVALASTCKALEALLLPPFLRTMGVIETKCSSIVRITFHNDTPSFLVPLILRMPPRESIYLALDLFFMEKYVGVIRSLLVNHRFRVVHGVTLRVNPDDLPMAPLATISTTLHDFLCFLHCSAHTIELESNPSCSRAGDLIHNPTPTVRVDADRHARRGGQSFPNVSTLSISLDWFKLPGFNLLYDSLLTLKYLDCLSLTGIKSQRHCDSLLGSLKLRRLRTLKLDFACPGGIQINPHFLERHPKLVSIMLCYSFVGQKFMNAPLLVEIPAIPDVVVYSSSSSLSVSRPRALRSLRIGPDGPLPFYRPWREEYCQQVTRYMGQIQSLAKWTFSGLDLHIQYPTNIALHMSTQVSSCQCAHLLEVIGAPVLGIARLVIDAYDMDSATLPLIAQSCRRYVDAEHITLKGTAWDDSLNWGHVAHACHGLGRTLEKLKTIETPLGDYCFD